METVFLMTYYGDDEINQVFTEQSAAINFALKEIKHYMKEEGEVVHGSEEDYGEEIVIVQINEFDERPYIIREMEINPTFSP